MRTWEAMTPRERDAEIEEKIFGRHPDRASRSWQDGYACEDTYYTTDPEAARLVEDEIERRELKCTYVTELLQLCGHYTMRGDFNEYWDLVRAKPEQRCLAALRATALRATAQ
jgi:hypothetical protein